jgi:hypothetical protein
LKIFHEAWSGDRRQLTVRASARAGRLYRLKAYGAKIASVDGGELRTSKDSSQYIEVAVPDQNGNKYVSREIVIRF